jgi:hypothetical protein
VRAVADDFASAAQDEDLASYSYLRLSMRSAVVMPLHVGNWQPVLKPSWILPMPLFQQQSLLSLLPSACPSTRICAVS